MATHIRWKPAPVLTALIVFTVFLLLLFLKLENRRLPIQKYSPRRTIEYIDWKVAEVKPELGKPGENGMGVITLKEEQEQSRKSYEEYGFNQMISDKISLHRSLRDSRPISCYFQKFPSILPTTSVIIIFHNEGWSTLLRTVHSVLNRSPPTLIEEIILCDDFSNKDHLKSELEEYISNLPKVKLIRNKKREGLIRSKINAADIATGDVLLFLDAHCEVNSGWLPPLLSEIERDYRTVVCPTIDVIRHKNFEYIPSNPFRRGTFNWKFDYKEKELTAEEYVKRKSEADPVKSPVMAGGLFAISKKFWLELGKYDPGMYVWGGEQYEISFKLWMCGGTMYNMPCSRVGHVYRDKVPYKIDKMNAALINFKRVAEVWMDDFKYFLYHNRLDIEVMPEEDITERIALRNRLGCNDFRWYLDNVANETVRTRFEPDRAAGRIRHVESGLCIDTPVGPYNSEAFMAECRDNSLQNYKHTYIYEIRRGLEDCLQVSTSVSKRLTLQRCMEQGGEQTFKYTKKTKQIRHEASNLCLTTTQDNAYPTVDDCDSKAPAQKWELNLQNINKDIPEWAKIAETLKFYRIEPDKMLI